MPVHHIIVGQSVDEAKLRFAKELRRAMTPTEHLLWQRLRGNRLGGLHFRRQQVIDGFVVDFYCHAAALIVEVDGPVHLGQKPYDAERDRLLGQRGFRMLRFTDDEVTNETDRVLTRIMEVAGALSPPLSITQRMHR